MAREAIFTTHVICVYVYRCGKDLLHSVEMLCAIGHHRYTKTQCCTNNAYVTWKMCQTKRFRRHIGILGILKLYPSPI